MPSPTSPQGLFQPRGNRRKAAAVPQPQRNDDPQSFEMGVLPSVGGGQGGRAKDTGRRRESRPTVPTAGAVPASLCPRVLRLRPRGNRVPIPLPPPPHLLSRAPPVHVGGRPRSPVELRGAERG